MIFSSQACSQFPLLFGVFIMFDIMRIWATGLGGLISSYSLLFVAAGISCIYLLFKKPIYSIFIFIIVAIGIPLFQGYRNLEQINKNKEFIGTWSTTSSPRFEFKIIQIRTKTLIGVITSDVCAKGKSVFGVFKSKESIYFMSLTKPTINFPLVLNNGVLSGRVNGCNSIDSTETLTFHLSTPKHIKCDLLMCRSSN